MVVIASFPFLRDMVFILRAIRARLYRMIVGIGFTQFLEFAILLLNDLALLCELLFIGFECLGRNSTIPMSCCDSEEISVILPSSATSSSSSLLQNPSARHQLCDTLRVRPRSLCPRNLPLFEFNTMVWNRGE